jgi:hypothetical protein
MKKTLLSAAVLAAAVSSNASAALQYVDIQVISTASGFGAANFSTSDGDGGAAGNQTGAAQTSANVIWDDVANTISWAGSINTDLVAGGFGYTFTNGVINLNTGAFTSGFTCTDLADPEAFGGSTCGGWIYNTTAYGEFEDLDEDGEWDTTSVAPAADMSLFQFTLMNTEAGAGAFIRAENTAYADGSEYAQDYVFVFKKGDGIAAVPVPAAAWLFGSALVGLAGIGRKRK